MGNSEGSYNWDDPERPVWNGKTELIATYEYKNPDTGFVAFRVQRGRNPDTKEKVFRQQRPNMLKPGDRLEPEDKAEWYNDVKGVRLFPYRIADVVAAAPHVPILIVEGEGKVHTLKELGFVATCAPGGAGKFLEEYAPYFEGKRVVILADNDERGREHGAAVGRILAKVAKSVRFLDLPGLPERGDVVDWVQAGGDAAKLAALLAATPEQLETVRASDFAALETPKREWLFPGMMPARNVTAIYGDGGLGKSLLGMQCSVSVVRGSMFLGVVPQKTGPVIYFGAEDELDETHRRLKDICAAEQIDLALLSDLHLIDMTGRDALLAVEAGKKAIMEKTPLFSQLRTTLREVRPALLVLDNLADIFGGNEIVKSLARQFITMLREIAIEFDCVVLLLAHPSQSGRNSGEGTSGNSAWNNSVRQRLYLKPQEGDDGTRLLEVKKSNYGPSGSEIQLKWDRGRFVLIGAPPAPDGDRGKAAKEHKADAVFMKMLARLSERGDTVSPHRSPNHAPSIFEELPEAKEAGLKKVQLAAAMERLRTAGRIRVVVVGKGTRAKKALEIVPPEEVPF